MKESVISYDNLKITPFQVEHILSLQMQQVAGEHTSVAIIAMLAEEMADLYVYETGMFSPIALSYTSEEGVKILFKGIVTSLNISRQGEVFYLSLEAKSATCMVDIISSSRSFQNIEMTSHQVIKEVMQKYGNADVSIQIPDVPIGKLVVQYQETDWIFLKRFISRFGAVIIPENRSDGIKFFIGLPVSAEAFEADAKHYTVSKSMAAYHIMKENNWPDVKEIDFITFTVEDGDVFQVGDDIMLDGKKLCVSGGEHMLVDGIFKNKYYLKPREGIRTPLLFNKRLIGASVSGSVIGVARDKIQVNLEIDQPGKASYWFPYSTMSASPDGSGWYCMPEKGDQVRVYFPTKEESEAYAVSAISGHMPKDGDKEDPMGNPNVKYIKTAADKAIHFMEDALIINANSGQASIVLNKDGTVGIVGQNDINIGAKNSITLEAGTAMMLVAKDSVSLENTAGAGIKLTSDGNITLNGSQIYSN